MAWRNRGFDSPWVHQLINNMKIAISGSMSFFKEMLELKNKLEARKHIVIIPAGADKFAKGIIDTKDKWEKIKQDVIRRYFEEIKKADAILVINKDKNNTKNYIGGNGLIEMAFAHVLRKRIFLLNPIPQMRYTDEIKLMQPVILNGNINNI